MLLTYTCTVFRVYLTTCVTWEGHGSAVVIKVIIGEYYHWKCAVYSDMCGPKCRRNFAASRFTVYPYYNRIKSIMYPSFSKASFEDCLTTLMNLLS